MGIVLLLAIVVLLALLLYWRMFMDKVRSLDSSVPGPPLYPFIGNGHLFVGGNVRTFSAMCQLFREYPRCVRFMIGPKLFIGLSDPRLIEYALVKSDCQDKAYFYRFFEVGNGLISADYNAWKPFRKMLNPAFNQRILVSFISIFERYTEQMVAHMEQEAVTGRKFDVLHYTAQCTLEMICSSSLGSDIMDNPETRPVCSYIERVISIAGSRFFDIQLHSDFIFSLTARYREMHRLRAKVQSIIDPILLERRQRLADEKSKLVIAENAQENDAKHYRKPQIFLNQLLTMERDDQEISLQEIQCHLYTIIGAGNETTALQSAYILLMLAMHPDVQERVYCEIEEIYGPTREHTFDMLKAQSYLEQVIKESMRLFPVAPVIGRETARNIQLDDIALPRGVTLLFNIYTLHRRKDIWGERAECFDPDRFAADVEHELPPCSYMPFGAGPRTCIGVRYAVLGMKVMVTQVLRCYKLSTPIRSLDELEFSLEVTLRLTKGHLISIERRA